MSITSPVSNYLAKTCGNTSRSITWWQCFIQLISRSCIKRDQQKWNMVASASFTLPQMNWDAPDPVTVFGRCKQKCQLMFKSILIDTDDKEKVSCILLWSGEKGLDMHNSWTFTKEDDRKKPEVILKKFENQLEPKTSHRIHEDTHYKEYDKNRTSQLTILSQE